MGADQCDCKGSQAIQVYDNPDKRDACKMFTKSQSSKELDQSQKSMPMQKRTIYRGFTEDPNVKIRFIAETKSATTVIPQSK